MALKIRIKEIILDESPSKYTVQTKGIPNDLFYVLFVECWWWWLVPMLNFFMLAVLICTTFESVYWKQKGLWVSSEETYNSISGAYTRAERIVRQMKIEKRVKVKKQIKYHDFNIKSI